MAGTARALMLVGAVALTGTWAWQHWHAKQTTDIADATRTDPAPPMPAPVAPPQATEGRIPGDIPPSISTATPAEIEAMRQSEARASVASAPVATFKGPDGRQQAFRYETAPAEATRQSLRDARRQDLMRELRADPAAFARRNGLTPHEAERILDGSIELPDRLLD